MVVSRNDEKLVFKHALKHKFSSWPPNASIKAPPMRQNEVKDGAAACTVSHSRVSR